MRKRQFNLSDIVYEHQTHLLPAGRKPTDYARELLYTFVLQLEEATI